MEKGAECHIGVQGKFIGSGSVFLGEDTLLKVGGGFSIGDNYRITLNPHTSIIIGDDCMASYDVVIRSNDGHSIFDVCSKENINSSYEISRERNVMIGDHVWLGQRTVILYYTQIGDGSIIGANSLVKSKVPNNCIAVGCPAKVIKRNIAWSRKEGAEHIDECGKNYVHYTEEI